MKHPLQEKRHFSLTLAPLFVKDLVNPQFSNSGAKMVIMWGYTSGAKIYGEKVVFVKKLNLVLNEYVYGAKHQITSGAKHHKIINGKKIYKSHS